MNDEIIIKKFIKNNKLISTYSTTWWLQKHQDIYEYLTYRYSDSDSINETVYRIYNNLEIRPLCPICGNKLKYYGFSKGFQKHCSVKCEMNDQETYKKYKETSLKRYGVDNPSKSLKFKEKYKETSLKRYGVEHPFKSNCVKNKIVQTCLEKYNTRNVFQSNIVKEKIKQVKFEKYGNMYYLNYEKTKKTQKNKYNGMLYVQTNKHKRLITKQNLYKWESGYYNSDEWKLKQSKKLEKEYITKKKNHTFNSSKIEKQFKEYLEQNYSDDFKYQYRSELYPFNCDFYIKSLDLYIEIQGNWTHGKHPFNENDENDLNQLNKWKQKNTKYYQNAINTWTIKDVNKRNIAKENNLNYLEIYSISLNNIINKLNNHINNYVKS